MSQTLYISIDGDTKGFVSALKKAENVSVSSGKRMATGVGQATKAYDLLKGAVVAYLGIGLVRETIRIADTYSLLESRLKLVTDGTEELKTVQAQLLGIANESRVSYEATANLYARLGRSTEQLGTSQKDLLAVTEVISKALIVSGASATEAENALIQLSQGLASGTLRGDELRSVLEQVPRVAKAIADGMGITVGQLREFGAEGKLTAEAVIPALISQLGKIDAEFSQIDVTVAQAGTVFKNALFDIVDSANDGSEATKGLSASILEMANTLTENKEEIVSVFTATVNAISAVVKTTAALANTFAGFKAVSDGTLSFFELATSNAEELDAKLGEIAKSGGTVESFKERLSDVNSEIKWLSEQMGKSGPENAKKYQGEINRLRVEKIKLLKTLDDLIMSEGESAKAAEDSADKQQDAAEETASVKVKASKDAAEEAEKALEKEVRAAVKAGEDMVDSWELIYQDRYEIISRTLDNEIQAEEEKIAAIKELEEEAKQAEKELYEEKQAIIEKYTEFAQERMSGFFSQLIDGDFKNASDAWDALWKSMLKTVADTVSQMAAKFVVGRVVDAFFHEGEWNLKGDEYRAVLKDGEMVIPPRESDEIRSALGDETGTVYGFKGLLAAVRRGAGELTPGGEGLGMETAGVDRPGIPGHMSAAESYGRFAGGIAGRGFLAAIGVSDPLGLTSRAGHLVGAGVFGALADLTADAMDVRSFEDVRDAFEMGHMTEHEARSMMDRLGNKEKTAIDGISKMAETARDTFSAAMRDLAGGAMSALGIGDSGGGHNVGGERGSATGTGGGYNDGEGGVTGLAVGTDFVERPGIFQLHRGEAVTPAREQQEQTRLLTEIRDMLRSIAFYNGEKLHSVDKIIRGWDNIGIPAERTS